MLAEDVDFLSYLIYSLSWQLFICFWISHFYSICGKTLLSSTPAALTMSNRHSSVCSSAFWVCTRFSSASSIRVRDAFTWNVPHTCTPLNWCYLFRKKWIDQLYVWTCPSATDKSDMTNFFACIRFYIFWYWQASKRRYNKVHKFLKDDTFVWFCLSTFPCVPLFLLDPRFD